MSHVCDTILLTGLVIDDAALAAMLAEVNEAFQSDPESASNGLVDAKGPALPRAWYGGSKALQCEMFVGAFNYLNLPRLVKHLRAMDWTKYDVTFVDLVWKDEHDYGFGLLHVYAQDGCRPAQPEATAPDRDWEPA